MIYDQDAFTRYLSTQNNKEWSTYADKHGALYFMDVIHDCTYFACYL